MTPGFGLLSVLMKKGDSVFKRVAVVVTVAALTLGGVVATAAPAHATDFSFSACFPSGPGTPPASLEGLTVEITGAPPPSVVQDAVFDVPTTVVIHNPTTSSIDTSGVTLGALIPDDANPVTLGFSSPSPFSIPAGGSAQFSGVLQYVGTGAAGTVLEFVPGAIHFRFGASLSVGCNFADPAPFASTVVVDAPGYRFSCSVLGITLTQTIDVVGIAPASVAMGSAFSLTDVVTTSTSPVATTVQSVNFSLASPENVTPTSPLSVTTPGPFTVPAGQPITSTPMTFDFVASGPVGSVIEFRPSSIVTVTDFGTVNCTVLPGEPALATTTIVGAVAIDEVAAIVIDPRVGVVYAHHSTLSSGDFDFTRNAKGTLITLQGAGSFTGSTGGAADLRLDFARPRTNVRLTDPSAGIELRAVSLLPLLSPSDSDVAIGVAFSRLNGTPVIVIWAIRDA